MQTIGTFVLGRGSWKFKAATKIVISTNNVRTFNHLAKRMNSHMKWKDASTASYEPLELWRNGHPWRSQPLLRQKRGQTWAQCWIPYPQSHCSHCWWVPDSFKLDHHHLSKSNPFNITITQAYASTSEHSEIDVKGLCSHNQLYELTEQASDTGIPVMQCDWNDKIGDVCKNGKGTCRKLCDSKIKLLRPLATGIGQLRHPYVGKHFWTSQIKVIDLVQPLQATSQPKLTSWWRGTFSLV